VGRQTFVYFPSQKWKKDQFTKVNQLPGVLSSHCVQAKKRITCIKTNSVNVWLERGAQSRGKRVMGERRVRVCKSNIA
jgi:hypothetical protein